MISPVNVTESVRNCGFGHIYWRNPQWKTSFFVQWIYCRIYIFLQKDFEKHVINHFDFEKVLIEESNSHDINFFNDKSEVEDSPYFSINEFNSSSQRLTTNSLHICIRSLNKNFEKLR